MYIMCMYADPPLHAESRFTPLPSGTDKGGPSEGGFLNDILLS